MKSLFLLALAIGVKAADELVGYDPQIARSLAYLAGAAYCSDASVSAWTCKPCKQYASQVAGVTFLSSSWNQVYGYAAKATDGSVIIAFRGTDPGKIQNWIVDLNASKTELYPACKGCSVHSGFYTAYLSLSNHLLAALNKYDAKHAPKIIITGHSLGGAMASIAAFELVAAGFQVTQVINYGEPRVGNPAFAHAYHGMVKQASPDAAVFWTESELLAAWKALPPEQREPLRWSPLLELAFQRAHAPSPDTGEDSARSSEDALKTVASGAFFSEMPTKHLRTRQVKLGRIGRMLQAPTRRYRVEALQGANSIRVIHNRDVVPHLPPKWMGFEHAAQEVWYTEDQSSFKVCDPNNGEDPNCSNSNWINLSIPDHLNYMMLPISGMC